MLWEFKQGNTVLLATAQELCSVYSEGVSSDRAIRNWFVKIRSGDMALKDELRMGRPSDFDDDVLKSVLKDPRQSTRELAEKLNTSLSTSAVTWKNWGKSANWVYGLM